MLTLIKETIWKKRREGLVHVPIHIHLCNMHIKYTDDIPVCKLHIKHVCSEMKGDGRG